MNFLEPHVSDHAIIRYLERVEGLDVDSIRKKILTPFISDAARLGALSASTGGFKYVFKNSTVITVIPRSALTDLKSVFGDRSAA